jgi:hypothetical protein
MAYESRRVVTGNTPEGKSTVLYDSQLPLLGKNAGAGLGKRTALAQRRQSSGRRRGFPSTTMIRLTPRRGR